VGIGADPAQILEPHDEQGVNTFAFLDLATVGLI
jgi:hypothetical protein